jgi:hypothetical protein
MFKTLLRGACLSAALAAGAANLTATPATAQGLSFGITIGEDGYRHGGPRHHDRGYDRGYDRRADFCSPRRALREASRYGVRRPYIARETRRAVTVASARNGAEIRFAQRRDCPVISYRR